MVITNGRTRFHQRTATVYEAFPLSEVRAWLLAGIRKSARSFAEDIWLQLDGPLRHVG
jgi:CII-binding regulator of phage lambda lysogenization HflD